jgi:broad specificity phosphatase PhoE
LAEDLRQHNPTIVVTSTEPKAVETGAIIAERLEIPLETAENLHEHDRRGEPFFSERGAFEDLVVRLFRNPHELVFGNETADQAYGRFSAAVDAALQRHPEGNVAVVSHGTVMTLFVARRTGVEPVRFWKELGLPAAVTLRFDPTAEDEQFAMIER